VTNESDHTKAARKQEGGECHPWDFTALGFLQTSAIQSLASGNEQYRAEGDD